MENNVSHACYVNLQITGAENTGRELNINIPKSPAIGGGVERCLIPGELSRYNTDGKHVRNVPPTLSQTSPLQYHFTLDCVKLSGG